MLNHFNILNIVSDNASWVLDYEASQINLICKQLKIKSNIINKKKMFFNKSCIHLTSQFSLPSFAKWNRNARISVDYYHGTHLEGNEFLPIYNVIKKNPSNLYRIRVSTKLMESYLLGISIPKYKIHRIPIGIDTKRFKFRTEQDKMDIKKTLGIPEDSIVIGSFQKDGNGWAEGNEPKLIKGPDVLLDVINSLKEKFKKIHVLLTGPARGFVKNGLKKMQVPFTHIFVKDEAEIFRYFQALDLYLVTSRIEGGPKAILESMSTGVPIVSTKVGQAVDLIHHGKNGWLSEIEDVNSIVENSIVALDNIHDTKKIIKEALKTAEENSYHSQISLWKEFFEDYVESI